jgi:predicted O-methyltransferase YrrM
MNFLPEEIELYVEGHTRGQSELLAALERETWQKVIMPRMLSGHVQGRFLSLLSKMLQPRRILEIGTYTGYSALCLAEGLAPSGELITIDINDELSWIHAKYVGTVPAIRCLYGDALSLLPGLDLNFDLVFIDADKDRYKEYYDLLVPSLPAGAVVLLDNVLWSGKVVMPAESKDKETQVLQELNKQITADTRVENVLLPLRDGLMMVRKK